MAKPTNIDGVEYVEGLPRRQLPKDHVKALAAVVVERQEHALAPQHVVILNYGFEEQKKLWADATERDRHAIVYGMVLHDGAIGKGMKDIARFFGLDTKDMKPYAETFEMAKAALKLKIQRNQISIGLQREDQPNFKFMLGKQWAEQVAEPAHEDVSSVQTTPPQIVINTASGANDELRAELDAAVHAAMTVSKARSVQ